MAAAPTAPPTRSPDANSAGGTTTSARKPRRVRVPTFALVSASGLFPILEEFADDPALGYALWRLASDALVFASSEDRSDPFAAAPLTPPNVDAGPTGALLRALAFGLRRRSVEVVDEACAALATAAEQRGTRLTAAIFAEARALAGAKEAEAALQVATLARDRADYPAAEWWGLHSAKIARRSGKWSVAVGGYARAADAWEARGRWRRAVPLRHRELAAARSAHNREQTARAAHSLFVAYWYCGEPERADWYVRLALRLYPEDHPRLRALAHDVARSRLERGDATSSYPVFRNLLSVAWLARDRLIASVSLARAAALLDDRDAYSYATSEALDVLNHNAYGDNAAWALVELAQAALDCKEFGCARRWAQDARTLASERGDRGSVSRAALLLARIER